MEKQTSRKLQAAGGEKVESATVSELSHPEQSPEAPVSDEECF
jgi:hypothetical protein